MVFQAPNVLPLSIERNFTLPLRHALALSRDAARERMQRALVEAELFDEVRDRLHANAMTLSGGQQQRLCLARALALQPSVLLLDEPTASLDFRATAKSEGLLLRLKARYTIVAVSHSLGQTSRLADRCLVLRDGRSSAPIAGSELRDPARLRQLVDEAF
jgi:phosphate transport system ATP-binding protein